jgi:hypothetical protein
MLKERGIIVSDSGAERLATAGRNGTAELLPLEGWEEIGSHAGPRGSVAGLGRRVVGGMLMVVRALTTNCCTPKLSHGQLIGKDVDGIGVWPVIWRELSTIVPARLSTDQLRLDQ